MGIENKTAKDQGCLLGLWGCTTIWMLVTLTTREEDQVVYIFIFIILGKSRVIYIPGTNR